MLVRRALLAIVVAFLAMPPLNADAEDLACAQQPGNRFFWMERAFCDLELNGPDRANGVIIWNHGISGTNQSWMAPAPPVLRLLQSRGWDVLMLKRHHAAETDNALYRTVQRTLQEAATLKKSGYRKVTLAGQSFGGYATLEAVDTSPDIDAAIAFAPGVRSSGAGRLDPSIIERILQRAKVGRLALLFPRTMRCSAMSSGVRARKRFSRAARCLTFSSTKAVASAATAVGRPAASPSTTGSALPTSSPHRVCRRGASSVLQSPMNGRSFASYFFRHLLIAPISFVKPRRFPSPSARS